LSAFLPPYSSDELHYHLPESNLIVNSHQIKPNLSGHYFYGNIPKLMEIIMAIGIVFQGYELAHLLNFSIMFWFLILVFGLVRNNFGLKAASISVLLICLYGEYAQSSVNGFVDSATNSFEIGGLLLSIEWILHKSKNAIIGAAFLIGFAISIKYSALITLTVILLIIFASGIDLKNRSIKLPEKSLIIYFSIILIVISGYWYIKNLILYQNPTYPLYFGHKGVSQLEYQELIEAIQEFGPRDPVSFIKFPIVHYFNVFYITTFFSFFVPILLIFTKKFQKFRNVFFVLIGYYIFYVFYWFFLATHQTRFLAPSILVSLILTAIFLSSLSLKKAAISVFAVIALILVINHFVSPFDFKDFPKKWYVSTFNVFERQYALGKISQQTFLTSKFGCQFKVVEYLMNNHLQGNVIDNWTIWHDQNVDFYDNQNDFINFLPAESTPSSFYSEISKYNISYIYVNSNTKESFSKDKDPIAADYFAKRISPENYLIKKSQAIFIEEPCRLYRINPNSI
jgi:hypothetical protein